MKRKMLLRLLALPLVGAMGALPGLAGCDTISNAACPEFASDFGASLGADVDVNVRTFMLAAGNFDVLAEGMIADVSNACIEIAKAGGGNASKWEGLEGSDLVEAACLEAQTRIDAVLVAGVSIEFLVEGGGCQVSLDATADCYAQCDVDGKCTPGQLEAKCEPGKLAGSCSGECSGSCQAEAGSVACKGTCSATCSGSCNAECVGKCNGQDSTGACDGTCEGRCQGTCDGSCSGECVYTAPKAACEGTCRGECDVEFTEPYCEGKFEAPECDIDVDCQANCEASVQATAVCTPPQVTYRVVAGGNGDIDALAAALQKHLPALLVNIATRGEALIDTATTLATSADAIATSSGELSAKAGACAAVAAKAALSATLNVKASVSVSVDVSASAAARAGN